MADRRPRVVDADGSRACEYPSGDVGWAVRHMLQYALDADALAPAELREEIVRRLDGISA